MDAFPTDCRVCGSPFTEPVTHETVGASLKAIPYVDPKDWKTSAILRERNGVVCTNPQCRHYETYSLGEKLQLRDEGVMDEEEYEDFMRGYVQGKR